MKYVSKRSEFDVEKVTYSKDILTDKGILHAIAGSYIVTDKFGNKYVYSEEHFNDMFEVKSTDIMCPKCDCKTKIEVKEFKNADKVLYSIYCDSCCTVSKFCSTLSDAVRDFYEQFKNDDEDEFMDADLFARYIVNRCVKKDKPVSIIDLDSFLFIINVFNIMYTGKYLYRQDFVAIPLGPSIKSVRKDFSMYGGRGIVTTFDLEFTERFSKFDYMIDALLEKSPYDLSRVSKGSAWQRAFAEGYGKDSVIPRSLIFKQAEEIRKVIG